MGVRFIVAHTPLDPAVIHRHSFSRKGTAIGYIRLRLLRNTTDTPIELKHQVEAPAGDTTCFDEKTGLHWQTLDTWKYHKDGHIDHVRRA